VKNIELGESMAAPEPAAAADAADEVVQILTAAAELGRRYQRDDLVARLDAERPKVLDRRCRVLVIGEFKKGKSSLINALLNARVCAADADVATALPTLVRYGPELAVTALMEDAARPGGGTDGDTESRAAVPVGEVEALATEGRRLAEPSERRSRVRALDVAVPRDLLADGLILVDTPGVGGGLASAHAAATLRALAAADVVVFVSDAGHEYTAPELDFLRQAADLCPVVICALTKIDFYPEWRRILAADREHLRRAGLSYDVVPLSAPLRHHGLRTGDRTLLVESGYPRLAALLRAAAAATADTARAGAVAAAHAVLAQLVSRLSTEYDALRNPRGAGDRRAKWAEARQQAERLKSGGSRWQQVLADRVTDLASNVDLDLGVKLRAVRKEAAERIAADDPVRSWPQLDSWLHQRTNEALLDHFRVIRDQAETVADDVAGQFGAAAWELRVTVDVSGSGEVARDVELATVAADRSSRIELGLVAARGGSTGVILTHTVGLVLGLALPVTLPATAVLATLLAGKTWRTARAAQLRALRAEAERAVLTYLDEVEMVARKDSRDTVRQVQRQLREVFAERAAELYSTTAQNLEALARAVQEDERGRQDRLAEVGAELDRLRELAGRADALLDRLLAPAPAPEGSR
jgi:hypothetical protein